MMTESRAFLKNGHKCQIPTVPAELYMFVKQGSPLVRFYHCLVRFRMASDLRENTILRSQHAIYLEHKKHLQYLHIIHPFSDFRLFWEFFMILIFSLQFVIIPLDVAIYDSVITDLAATWFSVRILLDVTCLIDAGLSFFTGYCNLDKKEVVLQPRKIAVHYLKTYFCADVLTSLCAHADLCVCPEKFVKVAKFVSLLKLLRIFTFFRYCGHFSEFMGISFTKHKISMIVTCFTLYVHAITCTNIFIENHREYEGIEAQKWRSHDYIEGNNCFEHYGINIYKALQIINNMHFGLTPINDLIQIYIMSVWILSRIVYIFLIAEIMKLVITSRSSNIKYIEMVRQLSEYMRHKQIPESLQRRLLGYYEFRYQKSYFRESEILTTISGHLRQEIVLHSCQKLVEHVDFLKDLPMTLLIRIVSCLRCEVFLINDVVFRANTPGYCMYFIATGSVAVYTPHGEEICHLDDGEHFGEIALVFPNTKRTASIAAVEICELYRLDRKDFVKAIMPYPRLVEKIQGIAETRMEATETFEKRDGFSKYPKSVQFHTRNK